MAAAAGSTATAAGAAKTAAAWDLEICLQPPLSYKCRYLREGEREGGSSFARSRVSTVSANVHDGRTDDSFLCVVSVGTRQRPRVESR